MHVKSVKGRWIFEFPGTMDQIFWSSQGLFLASPIYSPLQLSLRNVDVLGDNEAFLLSDDDLSFLKKPGAFAFPEHRRSRLLRSIVAQA